MKKSLSLSLTVVSPLYLSLSFLSFAFPFLLAGPQILVGSLVNACLFSSVLFLPYPWSLSVVFFPSLAVLSRGLIFGPVTGFLFLMLPFIWLSNLILVFTFKRVSLLNNYWLAAFMASFVKFMVLYGVVQVLFSFSLVPKLFLTTMGINQFMTALIGGFIAFFIKSAYDHFQRT